MLVFTKDEDFNAFETVLEEAVARTGTWLLSYCLMGNHWHVIVWPHEDDAAWKSPPGHNAAPKQEETVPYIRRTGLTGS